MKSAQNLIPQLRFPEFKGEWVNKKLGKLGNFMGGGTPDSSKKEYWEGNIPWISSSDIKEGTIQKIEITRFITKEAINESATKVIPSNSVLIVSRVGIGKFAVSKQDICTSQDFTSLITNENSFFLAYYFIARSNRFVRLSQGTSIKGFTGKDIRNSKFAIPCNLTEQTKIATFLTAVDKRIDLLKKKKEELNQYKKGVMQKLFSQEIRFKDDNGNNFPDWEEKKLGEVCENVMYGLNSSAIDFNGKDKYIRITDIDESNNMYLPKPLTSPDGNLDDSFLVKKGDMLFTRTGASVGKTYIYNEKDGNLYFAGFLIRFSITKAAPHFVFYNTQTHRYAKWVKTMSMRSGQPGINAEEYKSFKIPFPSQPEQQKIADFLSSIDKTIEKVSSQIDDSVVFKQGLLQKMFV